MDSSTITELNTDQLERKYQEVPDAPQTPEVLDVPKPSPPVGSNCRRDMTWEQITKDDEEDARGGNAPAGFVVHPEKSSQDQQIPHSSPPSLRLSSPLSLLKQSMDRMLMFYCIMQMQQEEHEDFTESEMEAVQDMAINHLVSMFPTLSDPRNDELTRTRAVNYLTLHYELYKLRQAESRRTQLLDHFSDVIQLGEMEDFFVETSIEFHREIQRLSSELDKKIEPKNKKQKKKIGKGLSLRDVVEDLEEEEDEHNEQSEKSEDDQREKRRKHKKRPKSKYSKLPITARQIAIDREDRARS